MTVRHLVVGTAGHIDHGKSSLVRALTGIDPDRLKEEKARGITIALGFADVAVADDRVVSFVDVPGHERFVRHMVAGATGIDAVALVVAADDGVRPQTREHLEICNLLGVGHGFVVVTKTDLVDADLIEVVRLEVRDELVGSFLEDAPIVAASARTEAGIDDVRRELSALFDRVETRPTTDIARLPVDRSFVLKGFGTVVTGTLVGGSLREGQEVEILPGGRRGRVRGVQVHHRKVGEARAGQRTAVNLQGVSTDQVPRGSTLIPPGALRTTRRMWARLSLLGHAPDSLRRGGPVRFHHGTCERAARFRVLGEAQSGELDVELFLDQDTLLVPGDRFILRRPAPVDTVGGGTVADIRPPSAGSARRDHSVLTASDPLEGAMVRLGRAGREGCESAVLARELGMSMDELAIRLREAESQGAVVHAGGLLYDGAVLSRLREDVLDALETFHRDEPLSRGMSRERLRARLCPEMPNEAWRSFLERLGSDNDVTLAGELLAAPAHEVVLSKGEEAILEAVESRFQRAGLDPPGIEVVLAEISDPVASRLVDVLIDRGRLVRIRDGRLFHADALEDVYGRLREHRRKSSTIDVSTFKQLLGVTRKNAIPLLEHLDAERRTRRVGNVREILND